MPLKAEKIPKHLDVYIRGASPAVQKSVNVTKMLNEVVENTRTSFEIEGLSFSDSNWKNVKKAKKLLASVI